EGSMHAEGGFAGENPTAVSMRDHTAVALRTMEGLDSTSPGQFTTDAMSEAGATAMGQSLAHLMPILAEDNTSPPVSSENSYLHDGRQCAVRDVAALDSLAYVPDIPAGLIESMFGVVGGTDAGFAHLYTAITDVSQVNFAHAQASGDLAAWGD